jgi:hypothetical protein
VACDEIAPDGTLGRPLFRTKPDCLIRYDGRTVLVIDTKWKRLFADSTLDALATLTLRAPVAGRRARRE